MATVTVPLTEDPFKAHILDYHSDDDFSDDDDHSMEDNEDWADLEEEYEKKEDEDVAVFRAIVDHMPIESLLHLLQGHVRALQHKGKLETKVDVYDDGKQQQKQQEDTQETPKSQTTQRKKKKRSKKPYCESKSSSDGIRKMTIPSSWTFTKLKP